MKRILIISDDKPGHLNQSMAFCKLKKIDYDIINVSFKTKTHKLLSYFLDSIRIYTRRLFNDYRLPPNVLDKDYDAIVSAGSSTYYFNKYLSKKFSLISIVLMYPKGYGVKNFDFVIAQSHDCFSPAENIIEIPLNLSFLEPSNQIKKEKNKQALAIILGGSNDLFVMNVGYIKKQLDDIFNKYPDYLKYITTSRRTPKEIQLLLDNYEFDYKLIYTERASINPIGDFVAICDLFFITIDSTSMLSEVRANSDAKIEIIHLPSKKENTKYHRLVENIDKIGTKVNFTKYLEKIKI